MQFNFDTQRWFIGLFAMGLVLFILGFICMGEAGKSEQTSKENCQRSSGGIVVIAALIMGVAGFLMWKEYDKSGKFALYYY